MIIIFIGPPFSGKGTQTQLLGKELGLPVFAMGALIREARNAGNQTVDQAFNQYTMKGLHVPIEIKFPLLKEKMDANKSGFILDNFPERQDGLDTFLKYLADNSLSVDKVFLLTISGEERLRRMKREKREDRPDDDPEILINRFIVQDRERTPVMEYFRKKGILEEMNGEGKIEDIHAEIMRRLRMSRND